MQPQDPNNTPYPSQQPNQGEPNIAADPQLSYSQQSQAPMSSTTAQYSASVLQQADPGKNLSLIGLILFLMPIIGIPLSVIGMSKSKKAGYSGKLGQTGIIAGIIGIVVITIFSIVFPFIFLKAVTNTGVNERQQTTEQRTQDAQARIKVAECVIEKGVDASDGDAYARATRECEAEVE